MGRRRVAVGDTIEMVMSEITASRCSGTATGVGAHDALVHAVRCWSCTPFDAVRALRDEGYEIVDIKRRS